MDQSFEDFLELKNKPVEEVHTASKKSDNPTSVSRGFRTREVRVTKIPNHFQAKKTENILILVAFSIGLGSTWRFPYLCHQNGGGSFLLMYFILLLLLGIPLMYMEMVIGQWLRMDNIQAWKYLVPWLSGVGYSNILACVLVVLYNSALVSWSLFYLGQSFDYPLPWQNCPLVENLSMVASNQMEEGIEVLVLNVTLCLFATWIFLYVTMVTRIKISVLMMIFSILFSNVLLLCFFIRTLFLNGSVRASLWRLVTIELSILSSLDAWRQAGGHVLYSLGLGMGTIITFSTYQPRGENYIKWASFVAMVNLATSLLSSFVIFLVMGFWTTTSGTMCIKRSVSNLINLIANGVLPKAAWPPGDIIHKPPLEYLAWINQLPNNLKSQVIHQTLPCSILIQKEKIMEGPGLSYVAFSQAISLFPGSSFWAIIFFMSLAIMGLGTMLTLLEGIVLPLQKSISTFAKHPNLVQVLVCLGGFLGSLVFSSRPGSYVVFLFDDLLVPMVLIIIVVIQNLSLAWLYGIKRFRAEVFGQLGSLVWSPFTFLWSYVTLPTLLVLLTIYFLNLYYSGSPYYVSWNDSMSHEVKQPYKKIPLGWVTFLSVLALLPILVYPLQHWWYLDDPNICETLEKPLSSKKTVTVPNRVTQWPVHPMRKLTLRNQEKSKALFQSKSPPENFLHPQTLITKKDSENYSTFSLPDATLPSQVGFSTLAIHEVSKYTGHSESFLDSQNTGKK
ncbi:solute carrier family 6 (neurotransmitter transporter)-like isoform X3 [Mus musculus]|uniref:solute carrier family 6 (neurotransmitter transporter)-like isoform X3 n=1 Tax=Mus musculus TaxID=10090 RepID=UPI0000428DE9|nr:solute carrier family 6 (neurotransmitter transporter)-like isoform X3 [Mus musculus]|eukprot:XP_011249212.1 PREDICTED: solute carrier family 6 (neurotransmitter transporter)-like isoform X3 [Mus musculus]